MESRALVFAGLAAWVTAGLPLVLWHSGGTRLLPSGLAWLVFGLAFLASTWPGGGDRKSRAASLALLAVQTAAATVMWICEGSGFEGILLVLIAAQLTFCLSFDQAAVWVTVQTLLYAAIKLPFVSPLGVGLQSLSYLTFQAFALYTTSIARREAAQREELTRVNAELAAAQELLAETSRAAERARISRDLHDVLGHQLTALSLSLEVASHLADGRVKEEVEKARALARLLLSDVRNVVSEFREDDAIDLGRALSALASRIPRPRVEVRVDPSLRLTDPALAETLLRAAQEAVTNAVKHAGATTLVIEVRRGASGLELVARDDGHGASALEEGNGLRGLRERLAPWRGRLDVTTSADEGFSLRILLPEPT